MENFEKQDEYLNQKLKGVRPAGVPPQVLKDFESGVWRKIAATPSSGPAFSPALAAALAAALVLAGVLGVAVYQRLNAPEAVEQSLKPAVLLSPSPVILSPSAVILSEAKNLRINSAKDLETEILRSRQSLPQDDKIVVASEDSTLQDEIELLRELGAWTDDDDLAIGISLESLMDEVTPFLETGSVPAA